LAGDEELARVPWVRRERRSDVVCVEVVSDADIPHAGIR
jgi:hypothetical protein